MPTDRQYRHPVALSALRPFVRLSRRLERQVVTPAPAADPAPAPVAPAPVAPAPAPHPPAAPATDAQRPAPAPTPVDAPTAPPASAPTAPVESPPASAAAAPAASAAPSAQPAGTEEVDVDATSLVAEQFQSVDASVVPVPLESLNRLVVAVDELGTEMAHVRQAIRDLTAALSESQANFARLLAAQADAPGPAAPDPLAAVTGPYVSGSPTSFPGDHAVVPPAAAPDPPTVPMPTVVPPSPAPAPDFAPVANGTAADDHAGGTGAHLANGLGDLPIVSSGGVQVVIGPISSLDELDDAVEHLRRINGVESVAVSSFEGPHVVLTADLSRPLPLASLLRHELGREVASCRVVDGRIVADFGEVGRRA